MTPDTSAALRIAGLYAATFFGIGISMPFFPLWLSSIGLDADRIAIVLAVPMLVRVVASTWTAGLADGRFAPVRVLFVANLAVAGFYLVITPGPSFPVLLACMAMLSLAQSPLVPLSEVVAIDALKKRPRLHYGRIRSGGSLSFLMATLVGGALVGSMAPAVIPVALALSYASAAGIVLLVPSTPRDAPASDAGPSDGRIPRVLIATIAVAALVHASHAMVYAFGSLSFAASGYSPPQIGALWAVGVAAEIILFALVGSAVGERFRAFLFLGIGASASCIRWLGMALDPPGWLLAVLMASHGLSFGATHLGTIGVFALHAPPAIKARCQGVLVSVLALATACVTAASGPFWQAMGAQAFLPMVPLAAAGLALVFVARRLAQPQSAGVGGNTTLPS